MTDSVLELIVDDQKVVGHILTPDSASNNAGVLFLHGWTGVPNTNAAAILAREGFTAMTISMRGHQPSDGDIKTVTAAQSLDDAIAAYDFLVSKLTPDSRIYIVGNSYGSYIAALLSVKRAVAGLSLRVPAGYPDELFGLAKWGRGHDDPKVAAWRKAAIPYSENKAFQALHDFKGKIQIIEAELDDLVPHETVANYRNAVADHEQLDYQFMKGWPHSMGHDAIRNEQFNTMLLSWLLK